MITVVAMMRDLPAEVWSPKERVGNEAEDVVDDRVVRECTVTALRKA